MIEKIKKASETVEGLLSAKESLRDSDPKLIANFWFIEVGSEIENMSAKDFLSHFSQGKITTPESITRARRKVQEENEHLRGNKYKKRLEAEKEVRKNINK